MERPLPVFHGFRSSINKGLVLDSKLVSTAGYQKKIRNFSANKKVRGISYSKASDFN